MLNLDDDWADVVVGVEVDDKDQREWKTLPNLIFFISLHNLMDKLWPISINPEIIFSLEKPSSTSHVINLN